MTVHGCEDVLICISCIGNMPDSGKDVTRKMGQFGKGSEIVAKDCSGGDWGGEMAPLAGEGGRGVRVFALEVPGFGGGERHAEGWPDVMSKALPRRES